MEAIRTLPSAPTAPDYGDYISVDEFLEIADSPKYADCLVELVEGEIVTVPYHNRQHTEIMGLISAPLVTYVRSNNLGRVYVGDGGFVLERTRVGRDTLRGIDIAFMRADNAPDPSVPRVINDAPDLAIEIVSPGNEPDDIDLKIMQLQRAGTPLIWVFYPATRRVYVYEVDGVSILSESDTLTGGDVLPGFEVKVADLFPL